MPNLETLPLRREGAVRMVVETPARTALKLRYDAECGAFTISKPLPLGLSYPYDWGFFPSTRADDGDPLDALILGDAPSFPGVILDCRAIGVLRLVQDGTKGKRERNDRIIAVADESNRFADVDDARDLPPTTMRELEAFFLHVATLDEKQLEIEGWAGPKAAERAIAQAERRFAAK
jgi:inorganic pyrophosphatase